MHRLAAQLLVVANICHQHVQLGDAFRPLVLDTAFISADHTADRVLKSRTSAHSPPPPPPQAVVFDCVHSRVGDTVDCRG